PGESLAKYSRPATMEWGEEATETAEPSEMEVAAEELRVEAVAEEPPPEPAAPDVEPRGEPTVVVEELAREEAAPVEPESPVAAEAAAMSEPAAVEELPASELTEASAMEPAAGESAAEGAMEAAAAESTAQEVTREVGLRERPYGQRFLHRGSRRPRRRGSPERQTREGNGASPAAVEEAAPAPAGPASIADLLREGQEIIAQIAKEPIGKKGARITSHIALPGRYLVYMPTVDHVGVSRKIVSDEERLRLKRIVQTHRVGMPGGFIVRTAGEGQSEEEIRSDMHFLYNLWLDIRQKAERKPAPVLIHHDLNLVERILRDQLTETFKTIWVDSQEDYERILQFVERFQPALVNRVKLYTRSNPIFDEFSITQELEKALRPKVWLKSGGYIVINQTEALVAIDVNTGKYVGKSNRLEDTIVKTNTDAIHEIVRQIRLRDLGGIIVVDFIDMEERKNRQKVMQALDEALRKDRAPSKILQFNDFGLVAITRKRVKQSLERTLCSPCPYCDGSGYVKSVTTMIQEILVEAKKIARNQNGRDVTLRVHPEVAKVLKSRDNSYAVPHWFFSPLRTWRLCGGSPCSQGPKKGE
ncbi:MAG: Rne/Rng family ribonuclease, partial [Acidobacteria bacterium]|nr:Rne/Rng family ribonuclease [Acidobacteriota bacterium]